MGASPAPAAQQAQPLVSAPPPSQAAQQQAQEQMRGVVQTIQTLHSTIEDLAGQFPEFADDGKTAMDAIKNGMVKIIANMQRGAEVTGPSLA